MLGMKAAAVLQAKSKERLKNYKLLLFSGFTSIIAYLNIKCIVKGKHIHMSNQKYGQYLFF